MAGSQAAFRDGEPGNEALFLKKPLSQIPAQLVKSSSLENSHTFPSQELGATVPGLRESAKVVTCSYGVNISPC